MPIEEQTTILLPRAIDRGSAQIAVRQFALQIYANSENYIQTAQISRVAYSPSWARVQIALLKSGVEYLRVAGDNGGIELDAYVSNTESITVVLENNSIDTDVRLTFYIRAWQYGES